MTLELEEGEDLPTCTRHMLERVKATGLGEALLDTYGPRLIEELWRDRDDQDDGKNLDVGHDRSTTNGVAKTSVDPSRTSSFGATCSRGLTAQMVSRNALITATLGVPQPPPQEHQIAKPGPRRVNVEQLASGVALLESLFQVEGAWIRLGDLNTRQCKALQFEYLATAEQYRRRAIAFGRLGAGLVEGQTVRERWTGEQLANLVGDNLRGAAPA